MYYRAVDGIGMAIYTIIDVTSTMSHELSFVVHFARRCGGHASVGGVARARGDGRAVRPGDGVCTVQCGRGHPMGGEVFLVGPTKKT